MEQNEKLDHIRHSLSHLLAAVVLKKFPETKFGIGPVIENGFYYDFDLPEQITEEDLKDLEKEMKKLVKAGLPFTREVVTTEEAKKIFSGEAGSAWSGKYQPFKLDLIEEFSKVDKEVSIYKTGDIFFDLCRGGHVENTKEINPDTFKLMKIAGAYWRGDEKNKMLTRIYGLAFETKKELDDYLTFMEEAKKRDHRKLGKQLDLFHLDDVVGLGLPLWHPKGALLWRIIEDFWYQKHIENGYELVRTPHIGNRSLWEISGHWGFYNKSMYPPIETGQTLEERQQGKSAENSEEYLLKPMNCPFHVQIYKNSIRSYRDLPCRWAECGTVYRFEKKGELSGLTRVRGFTQDDAHIICTKDQVENELRQVIDFILFIYQSFGFNIEAVQVYLSLRDPKDKEKYAGNDEGWIFTENILRKVAQEKKLSFKEEIGEAAFYGPKLDFKVKDALGREWQCSTLQFDFNLPVRFDMSFVNNRGENEQPLMLHRALFGSYERFIGLLIEHYAGAFPVWLSPNQVTILPISEKFMSYGEEIQKTLKEKNIRVEMNEANETLGKRIREAEMKKTPYILVIGEKEESEKMVNVRKRHQKETSTIPIPQFIDEITKEIQEHK